MRILLNGTEKEIVPQMSLETLVEEFCRDSKRVIAELNGSIIRDHEWDKKILKEGDSLELVNFVGGG